MICLCCGEPIPVDAKEEQNTQWHKRCIRKFFNLDALPELDLDESQLKKLVSINLDEGLTIPGVQKKLSLHLSRETPSRLTIIDYPTGYILKPQTKEYRNLPEYEWLAMHLAKKAGIKVAPFALYRVRNNLVYLTKRIDRSFTGNKITRFAMEDFCQLSNRQVEDKYKGSYEGCIRIIRQNSANSGLDIIELFLLLTLSFLIGNSDLHLKNLSLIEDAPGSRIFKLSSAYDILPVNVVEPKDYDQCALSLNGKKRDLSREDFLTFAEYCEIPKTSATKLLKNLTSMQGEFISFIKTSFLSPAQQEKVISLILSRCQSLEA